MRARILKLLLSALTITTLVVGCGSDAPDPLPKTAFIEQGNAICKQAAEKRDTDLKEAAKESAQGSEELSSEAELEKFVTEVALPPIQTMTEELDDLGAPEKDERQVATVVDGFQEGIAKVEANPRMALTSAPFTNANRRANAYGLTECII